jgi:hypothetical protein
MIEVCTTYEAADGPAEGALAHAAAHHFERSDGRPARFRAVAIGPDQVRLTGSVRVRPPFALIGSELHVGHAVLVHLSAAAPSPLPPASPPGLVEGPAPAPPALDAGL